MTLGQKASNWHVPSPTRSVFELKPGVPGIVAGIRGGESSPLDPMLLTRLGELGFLAGESVTLLCRGPGGREPLAVQTGDTVVALRAVEARCILIED